MGRLNKLLLEIVSIHAPARGATARGIAERVTGKFRSTPLREGRPTPAGRRSKPSCFDPRPCARGDLPHGELASALCISCGARFPWKRDLLVAQDCPVCDDGALRPDVVLFGEATCGFSEQCRTMWDGVMAEREGFEPSEPLRAQRFSRPPRSTTPAPLRRGWHDPFPWRKRHAGQRAVAVRPKFRAVQAPACAFSP